VVPLTVSSSVPVHSHKLAQMQAEDTVSTTSSDPHCEEASQMSQPILELIRDNFISKLQRLVMNLPQSIPEASESDKLAAFGGDLRGFDDPSISTPNLWEIDLNEVLKATLGWGKEGNMGKIICHGK